MKNWISLTLIVIVAYIVAKYISAKDNAIKQIAKIEDIPNSIIQKAINDYKIYNETLSKAINAANESSEGKSVDNVKKYLNRVAKNAKNTSNTYSTITSTLGIAAVGLQVIPGVGTILGICCGVAAGIVGLVGESETKKKKETLNNDIDKVNKLY